MEEILDIVDANDNIIGQEPRSKCHAEKILHRAANILVFKDDSLEEILIQKRSLTKKAKPGLFCFPGGHLAAGDSYLRGAQREFSEEMYNSDSGENVQLEELFKIRKTTDDDPEFMTVFRTVSPGPFNIDPVEVDSYFFENINTALRNIKTNPEKYTETTVLLLNEYKQRYLK